MYQGLWATDSEVVFSALTQDYPGRSLVASLTSRTGLYSVDRDARIVPEGSIAWNAPGSTGIRRRIR